MSLKITVLPISGGAKRDVVAKGAWGCVYGFGWSKDVGCVRLDSDCHMSLICGGPFDTENNWNTPHQTHREGINADIDDVDANGRRIPPKELRDWVTNDPFSGAFLNERNHYHVTFR